MDSLLAAAAFWSPFFSDVVALFFGLQLPCSPCALPGVGSKPGQQWLALDDFFAGAVLVAVLLADFFTADLAGDFLAADFFAVAMCG